ncbi:MAG: contractile injection system protein, VgrG/Pvc8 family [Desulfobulbus sp.]|nr:contractile injection system protein, VgrG/Pvc8 family [Desulfobulbus sp.]
MDVRPEELARRAQLQVTIGGHDATSYIEPYLTSFTFSDQAEGKSDEIQIELHDRDGKWRNGWLPSKGAKITAAIRCLNWFGPGQSPALNCGSFTCDEVSYSGPPDKVSIKGVSASLTGPLRETERTQGWEAFSLEGVAGDIAGRNGLSLFYDAGAHAFDRQDQRGESDLAFLTRLAEERGVSVKVRDDQLILYGARDADARPAGLTFQRSGEGFATVSEYDFKEKSEGTGFTACEVQYHDPATGETHTATYNPSGKPLDEETTIKPLVMDRRIESEAAAMELARNSLRGQNGGECAGSFTIMGHPGLVAGMTVSMSGFGRFDGAYFVTKADHKLGGKYTTSAEIRRVMGY